MSIYINLFTLPLSEKNKSEVSLVQIKISNEIIDFLLNAEASQCIRKK